MEEIRLGELLGAMSLALDLAEGEQAGHTLRACLIGMRLAERAGLTREQRGDLYDALLLKDAGCSSNAARISAVLLADDHRAKRSSKRRDLNTPSGRLRHALAVAAHGEPLRLRVRTLRDLARGEGLHNELIRIRCERGAQIADGLGCTRGTIEAIYSLDEHWDGHGHPHGLRGDEIPLLARIAGLAQTAEICGIEEAKRRAGRWFDPALASLLEPLPPVGDLREAVRALQPPERALPATEARISRVAHAFAEVIDAKSPATGGHSHRVAAISAGAAERLGLDTSSAIVRAALLHDLGKLAVSNRILDKPGPLTRDEWDVIRTHPMHTEEILGATGSLEPIARIAAAHHERLDGSGYPHGLRGDQLPPEARLIAVTDAFEALTSDRPYRPAWTKRAAIEYLREEAAANRLDAECVAATAAFAAG